MPEVGYNTETETVPLESAGPDGFVEIRRFGFGERLKIRGLAARVRMEQQTGRKSKREPGNDEDEMTEMSFDMEGVTFYKFSKSIIKHNLTINGKAVNFQSRSDFAKLDASVGEEIEEAIDKLNPAEGTEEDVEGETPLGSESSTPSTSESNSTSEPKPVPLEVARTP
jgi:hypothetical protein